MVWAVEVGRTDCGVKVGWVYIGVLSAVILRLPDEDEVEPVAR